MAQTAGYMNDAAETTPSEAKGDGSDMLRAAVECRLHEAGETFNEHLSSSGWITCPFTSFTLLLRGGSRIAFDKDPATAVDRGAGRVSCIPAGAWRKADCVASEGASFVWARVSFTLFGGPDLLGFFDAPRVFPPDASGRFAPLIAALVEAERGMFVPAIRKTVRIQRLLHELLDLTLELSAPKPGFSHALGALRRLAAAAAYLGAHFDRPAAVDVPARLACLSKSRFHRVFKEAFGVSPAEYQIRLRMREAQKLLLFSDLSIAQIAERTGYADQFHFSRTFKRRFGQSPAPFRRDSGLADKLGL